MMVLITPIIEAPDEASLWSWEGRYRNGDGSVLSQVEDCEIRSTGDRVRDICNNAAHESVRSRQICIKRRWFFILGFGFTRSRELEFRSPGYGFGERAPPCTTYGNDINTINNDAHEHSRLGICLSGMVARAVSLVV